MILKDHSRAIQVAAQRTDRTGRPHYAVPYQGAWMVTDRNPDEKPAESSCATKTLAAIVGIVAAASIQVRRR